VQNNPAVRLYNLSQRLRSASGNRSPARLWAQALDIHINRELTGPLLIEVTQGILGFLDLLKETETGVQELEFDDFYSEAFPPLKAVAEVSLSNLGANQSNLTQPITDETVTLLRVIASEWEKKKADPKIDEQVLQRIQAEAHALFEAIKRAELDHDLKRLLLLLTSEIEQSIQHYRISGPDGLERALALIIGHASLNKDILDKARADQRTKIWRVRFYKIATKLFEVVKFANDTRKTIDTISPLVRLLGATDEIPPVDLEDPGKE
jgi:hypothetical protein